VACPAKSDGKIQRIVGRLVTDDEAVFLEINSVMGNRVLWSGDEIEALADLGLGRDSVEKVMSLAQLVDVRFGNSTLLSVVVTDFFDVLRVGARVCKLKLCGSEAFLDPLRTLSGLSGHVKFCCCGLVNGQFCRVVREVLMAVPGA
jgi:hypothetical protein